MRKIFLKYWTKHQDQEGDRWQEFLDDGIVSVDEAEAWADEIWPLVNEEGEDGRDEDQED